MQNIPLKIAAVYALTGGLWILFSDLLLQFLVFDPSVITRLSMFKGWAFITLTTVVLYRLIARDHAEIRRSSATVREREELLQNVLKTLPVGVWLLDRNGTITHGNPAGQRIWRGARLVGIERFGDYKGWRLETGKRIEAQEWGAARAIREGRTIIGEEIEIEGFDGIRRIILHSAVPLRDQQNMIVGAVVVNEDITSRKRMEESLRQSEQRFRSYFELGLVGTAITSPEKYFLAINDKICEIFGYERGELMHMSWVELVHPDDLAADVTNFNRILAGEIDGYSQENRYLRKDGQIINATLSVKCLRRSDGSVEYCVAHLQDITDRKRSDEKIATYQEQLRFMASEMSLIEERERRQLATTLHDQIGQVLALAKIKLGTLQAAGSAEECHRSAGEIRELLEQAIKSSRSLTFELSPPILYELGFETALQALCEKFQQQHGLRLEFVTDHEPKSLPDDMQILLFRAVRELLVNIVKHARAGSVQVSCRRDGSRLLIVVADDGKGFEPSADGTQSPGTRGFGLFSIRERLHHLGGEMTIDSAPGQGTRVTLSAQVQESVKGGASP